MEQSPLEEKPRRPPPPLVPHSAREWLMPMGRALVAAAILLGCSLAYLLGWHAHILTSTAARH